MALLGAVVGGVLRDLTGAIRGKLVALHVIPLHSTPRFISDTTLTVSTTSVGLPASIPPEASYVWVQVTAADIYFTLDQALPSSTNGMRATNGDDLYFYGNELTNVRFLRQAATDAILLISYFQEDEK